MLDKDTFFKVLNPEGKPRNGGHGTWYLPRGNSPGKWMPKINRCVPCESGYHVVQRDGLLKWLGPEIFVAEVRGNVVAHGDKFAAQEARLMYRLDTWNETTARLFAADCAKYTVRQCEKNGIVVDPRVKSTIKMAYRYARGAATSVELTAARSAAQSAAESAWSARSAAWSAESAAQSAWSAARSAESAARSAAWSAESAAWSAARSAARKWHTQRLFEYLNGERG